MNTPRTPLTAAQRKDLRRYPATAASYSLAIALGQLTVHAAQGDLVVLDSLAVLVAGPLLTFALVYLIMLGVMRLKRQPEAKR